MEEKKYFNPLEGELVKDKIVCRLINEEANRAYLQDKPYTQVEDLAVVYSVGMLFMEMRMPRSYYFIGFLLSFLLTTGMRFSYRILRFYINSSTTELNSEKTEKEHIMVIGAGAAGQALIKEIINSDKLDAQVVCIIDDNPTKYGRILEGITIVGDRYQIP